MRVNSMVSPDVSSAVSPDVSSLALVASPEPPKVEPATDTYVPPPASIEQQITEAIDSLSEQVKGGLHGMAEAMVYRMEAQLRRGSEWAMNLVRSAGLLAIVVQNVVQARIEALSEWVRGNSQE